MSIRLLRRCEAIGAIGDGEAPRETVTAGRHVHLGGHSAEEGVAWILTLARMGIKSGAGRAVAGFACEDQRSAAKGLRRNMFDGQRAIRQGRFHEDLEPSSSFFVVDLQAKGARVQVSTRLSAAPAEGGLGLAEPP